MASLNLQREPTQAGHKLSRTRVPTNKPLSITPAQRKAYPRPGITSRALDVAHVGTFERRTLPSESGDWLKSLRNRKATLSLTIYPTNNLGEKTHPQCLLLKIGELRSELKWNTMKTSDKDYRRLPKFDYASNLQASNTPGSSLRLTVLLHNLEELHNHLGARSD